MKSLCTRVSVAAVVVFSTACSGVTRPGPLHTQYQEGRLADGYITQLQLQAGVKMLSDDEWREADTQVFGGFQYDIRGIDWPIGVSFGFGTGYVDTSTGSGDNVVEWESQSNDFYLGAYRDMWLGPSLQAYASGGALVTYARLRGDGTDNGNTVSYSSDDSAIGGYGQIGVNIIPGNFWTFGAAIRASTVDIEMSSGTGTNTVDVNAGGVSVLASAGYRF